MIKLFSDLGHDVFIRDVSFLGFPSYYVFIPNVSIFGRKTYEDASNTMTLLDTVGQDTIEDLFFPTSKFINDTDVIRDLVDAIAPNREEAFREVMMQEVLKLKFDPNFYWSKIPVSFFLTLFCYVLGEYANAKKYMEIFIEESGNSDDEYYLQILTYLSCLENGEIDKVTTQIPLEIIREFSSVENLFSDIKLPSCPNCCDCMLRGNCQTRPSFNIALKLACNMNRQIQQLDLRNLFFSVL